MFRINPIHFQDTTLEHIAGISRAEVKLRHFLPRFKRAQVWLDEQIMRDMTPVIPYKTGEFLGKIRMQNDALRGTGKVVVYVPPQGRKLYAGISYTKEGAKPMHYTNPFSVPYWGEAVRTQHQDDWIKGCRNIIIRGKA